MARKLDETTEEKDLGVYVTSDLQSSLQRSKRASKATLVLRMKENFSEVILRILELSTRPISGHTWNTAFRHDHHGKKIIELLEKVQQ